MAKKGEDTTEVIINILHENTGIVLDKKEGESSKEQQFNSKVISKGFKTSIWRIGPLEKISCIGCILAN